MERSKTLFGNLKFCFTSLCVQVCVYDTFSGESYLHRFLFNVKCSLSPFTMRRHDYPHLIVVKSPVQNLLVRKCFVNAIPKQFFYCTLLSFCVSKCFIL